MNFKRKEKGIKEFKEFKGLEQEVFVAKLMADGYNSAEAKEIIQAINELPDEEEVLEEVVAEKSEPKTKKSKLVAKVDEQGRLEGKSYDEYLEKEKSLQANKKYSFGCYNAVGIFKQDTPTSNKVLIGIEILKSNPLNVTFIEPKTARLLNEQIQNPAKPQQCSIYYFLHE